MMRRRVSCFGAWVGAIALFIVAYKTISLMQRCHLQKNDQAEEKIKRSIKSTYGCSGKESLPDTLTDVMHVRDDEQFMPCARYCHVHQAHRLTSPAIFEERCDCQARRFHQVEDQCIKL